MTKVNIFRKWPKFLASNVQVKKKYYNKSKV